MTQIMENICQKLANIRKSAGLTQTELAALIKRSSSYISRIESGEREHTPALIADWLKACKPKIGWTEKEYLVQLKELSQYQNVDNSAKIFQSRAQDFFRENYVFNSSEFQEAFRSAHELHVVGMGQLRMTISYISEIKRILADDGKVTFVLCDPESAAPKIASEMDQAGGMDTARQEIWSVIDRLVSVAREKNSIGSLSIKLIAGFPTCTMYGFDLHAPEKARIFVWITPFRESSDKRPGFSLSILDGYWYNFFATQFDHFEKADIVRTLNLLDYRYHFDFDRKSP
jgi:transcriptional regulator with XRE-family HTH domain